jgi:hypothetical protein
MYNDSNGIYHIDFFVVIDISKINNREVSKETWEKKKKTKRKKYMLFLM